MTLVRTLGSPASRNGFSQQPRGFHTFSSLPLLRECETPPDAEEHALGAVWRKKNLRRDSVDLAGREAPRARSIERHEIAVPVRDIGAREEHDEISIVWIFRDVRGDIRTPRFNFDEQHADTAIGAQVGSLAAAERELVRDHVPIPFERPAEFVLPELMLRTTATRLLERDAVRREQRNSVRREREDLHLTARRAHRIEAREPSLDDGVLRPVTDFHVPPEALVAVCDRHDRHYRHVAQECFFSLVHRHRIRNVRDVTCWQLRARPLRVHLVIADRKVLDWLHAKREEDRTVEPHGQTRDPSADGELW